ncbi:LysR family transcriptional regulator [Roseibium litorale]|uniref:LysR family transcriptional regulator n=1 Tax=Roseibium litorale TaxID=2803841 RepID=A0ABR9CS03_9HYPH|nr:LysR family transcriptional regulator [Roseibium litorale]MBD8893414.1 LysR family transcriptional regulator [Roseibium litorale]
MDWHHFPSLSSLRAFAAVAEEKNLSAAGRKLNVTHAAISQQVRSLEAHLGVELLRRAGRGVALTPAGEHLAESLAEGFGIIAQKVDEIQRGNRERPLNITLTPSFAVSWLMPRISDFKQDHPEVELMLNPTSQVIDLAAGDVDLAIRFGTGSWPGFDCELLLASRHVVVGAASLLGDRVITDPAEMQEFHWLQELGTNEVSVWMERQGVVPKSKLNITHLPGYMILDGLRRGHGITATARIFVESLIETGAVRVLFEDTEPVSTGYHMVTRPGLRRPPLKVFMAWLRRKAAEDACCFPF